MPTHKLLWVFIATFLALPGTDGKTKEPTADGDGEKINVSGERPFDGVNIFGDFGKSLRSGKTEEVKLWWELMIRGQVGKDRFLILCALKNGNWNTLGDVRDFVEFQLRATYHATKLRDLLGLMSVNPYPSQPNHYTTKVPFGEGWLEKNPEADPGGISSQWRIAPSVLPLLYFLLMSCPEENRCE